MTVIALAVLMTGLVLGVFAMLYGTERSVPHIAAPHERHSEHDPRAEPSPVFNLASLAAFAIGFGGMGYYASQLSGWPTAIQVIAATLVGGATMSLQSLLIARWAIPSARADAGDERFLLQGTIGRVTIASLADGTGEMCYALDSREYRLPVRAMDGRAMAVGTEVVMDRVQDGVAFVELWAAVEARL